MTTVEFEARYRVLGSRDRRFDGQFFVAVTSTGVYCRPSCPAIVPKRRNVRFYPTAAAAQAAGFRACLRCHPHAVPGSPLCNQRGDLAARALGLIADGVVDREGVSGLARRLSYSERHLHRQLQAEFGAGPLALARSQRAQTARMLIQSSRLPMIDIAHAAGFSSVRQFNDTIRSVYARTPTRLRRTSPPGSQANDEASALTLRLGYREPLAWDHMLAFLAARTVPGVEETTDRAYRRSLSLPHGHGIIELRPGRSHVAGSHLECALRLADLRDLPAAVQRARRLLDLDADPAIPDAHLAVDPLLEPLLRNTLGLRVPGAADGSELAVRAVLGQQISVAAARTTAGNLTHALGEPLSIPDDTLTHLFPTPHAIAGADLATLPGPIRRRHTLQVLARALAEGEIVIDPGSDRHRVRAQLTAIPGIGQWTTEYIAMRALADPDAFLPTDLGVKHALVQLGQAATPKNIASMAQPWRPWRAYALQHLWASCLEAPAPTHPSARSSVSGWADHRIRKAGAVQG